MEVGDKLKELNLSAEEMDKFTKAFKDEKFREMLNDYAREISDPENRKRYEEEIKLLEQRRGNTIEFIDPKPFRAVKTSVDGKQKCFINICANEKVGKPESKCAVSEDGRRGQCWSLPHSLHPARQDKDPKGNNILIYDVIFHPDTLHIASKNKRFMDMVDSTAIQGIQKAFKVSLDKNNVKEMKTKYKGTPRPCVIRKPLPGYKAEEPSEQPDPLAFPYPDERRPTAPQRTKPAGSPPTQTESQAEPKSFPIQPRDSKEPTKPNYTVKYRSFIDLQDFRYSRDSAQSPRPKEIVITVEMPLLKSVADTSLEVKGKILLLESRKPAYRLELPLAYPVDEDKGEAKFNKQKGRLTVSLPVLPPDSAFDFCAGPLAPGGDFQSDGGEGHEEKREAGEEDRWGEGKGEKRGPGQQMGGEEEKEKPESEGQDVKQETRKEKGEEEEEEEEEEREEKTREVLKSEEEDDVKWKQMERRGQETVEGGGGGTGVQKSDRQNEDEELSNQKKSRGDGGDGAAEEKDPSFQCDVSVQKRVIPAEGEKSGVDDNTLVASPTSENQVLKSADHLCDTREEEEVNLTSGLEPTPEMKHPAVQETETGEKSRQGNTQAGTDAPLPNQTSSGESQTTAAASSKSIAGSDDAKSGGGDPSRRLNLRPEGLAVDAEEENRDGLDEDDLAAEQVLRSSERDDEPPPPALLREIDEDGNETVISDHSTCAGFVLQNTLMYELD